MIIDVNAIKRAGKTSQKFFFEYDGEFDVPLPNATVLAPVKVLGEVFLTENGGAETEGEIVFTVKGECTRCLAETEKEFSAEFSEIFGADGIKIVGGKIDLTKTVKETVTVNIPITFLCREDCKGICVGCGANLNESECKCNNK